MLLYCLIFIIFIGVRVKSFVPRIFEVGKPATIGCDIVYDVKERFKLTTLYFKDTNGIDKEIGDNNDNNVLKFDPVKDRATISIKFDKIEITFKELRYSDKLIFVCEGAGAEDIGKPGEKKKVTISIQNVQGYIIIKNSIIIIIIIFEH